MNRWALRAMTAALAALALGSASAAAGGQGFELTPAAEAKFPNRAFVLTLPTEMALPTGGVQVRENGEIVEGASVTPAGEEEGQSAVVLVIDATLTMRSPAIDNAIAAARAFAARRSPNQQLAIVTFNRRTTVLLPFSTNQAEIDKALASTPSLACCTPLYNAVDEAISLLEQSGVPAGAIVALSDGADNASSVSPGEVIARARKSHVRIFSVGLRSKAFRPELLQELAAKTDGEYSGADSSEGLAPIFDRLGQRLAGEYIIRYRSGAQAGDKVHVSVTVDGLEGVATNVYVSPSAGSTPEGPFHRSLADTFLHSAGSMVAASVVSALLLAFAFILLLRPRSRSVRARMAEFVSVAPPDEKAAQRRADVLALAEKSFEEAKWWTRFKEELEIAGIRMPAIQIVLWTSVATVFAAWFLYTVGGSIAFAPLGFGIPFVVRSAINRALERERRQFADQLPDNLQVLSSALRAGHSLVGALSVVVEDCPEPSRSEFRRVVADEQLGVPLEEALGVVARRMASVDVDQVALVSALQRETGGNTAEVLDRVAENVRGRFELRRLVQTLTAQGRMSRWIVSFLPVGLLGLLTLINPEYMAPLYTHAFGRVLLVVAALMVIAGSLVIKRIVSIKV
jgi:tight adherence protein B